MQFFQNVFYSKKSDHIVAKQFLKKMLAKKKQCQAMTRSDARCRKVATKGDIFCTLHRKRQRKMDVAGRGESVPTIATKTVGPSCPSRQRRVTPKLARAPVAPTHAIMQSRPDFVITIPQPQTDVVIDIPLPTPPEHVACNRPRRPSTTARVAKKPHISQMVADRNSQSQVLAAQKRVCSRPFVPSDPTGCGPYGDEFVPQAVYDKASHRQFACCTQLEPGKDDMSVELRRKAKLDTVIVQRAAAYSEQRDLVDKLKNDMMVMSAFFTDNNDAIKARVKSVQQLQEVNQMLQEVSGLVEIVAQQMMRCHDLFNSNDLSTLDTETAWKLLASEMVEGCHPLSPEGNAYIAGLAKGEIFPRVYRLESMLSYIMTWGTSYGVDRWIPSLPRSLDWMGWHDPLYYKKWVADWSAKRPDNWWGRVVHKAKGFGIFAVEIAANLRGMSWKLGRSVIGLIARPSALSTGVNIAMTWLSMKTLWFFGKQIKNIVMSNSLSGQLMSVLTDVCDLLNDRMFVMFFVGLAFSLSQGGLNEQLTGGWRAAGDMAKQFTDIMIANADSTQRTVEGKAQLSKDTRDALGDINHSVKRAEADAATGAWGNAKSAAKVAAVVGMAGLGVWSMVQRVLATLCTMLRESFSNIGTLMNAVPGAFVRKGSSFVDWVHSLVQKEVRTDLKNSVEGLFDMMSSTPAGLKSDDKVKAARQVLLSQYNAQQDATFFADQATDTFAADTPEGNAESTFETFRQALKMTVEMEEGTSSPGVGVCAGDTEVMCRAQNIQNVQMNLNAYANAAPKRFMSDSATPQKLKAAVDKVNNSIDAKLKNLKKTPYTVRIKHMMLETRHYMALLTPYLPYVLAVLALITILVTLYYGNNLLERGETTGSTLFDFTHETDYIGADPTTNVRKFQTFYPTPDADAIQSRLQAMSQVAPDEAREAAQSSAARACDDLLTSSVRNPNIPVDAVRAACL